MKESPEQLLGEEKEKEKIESESVLDEAIKSLHYMSKRQAKKASEWEKLNIAEQYEESEEFMRRFWFRDEERRRRCEEENRAA